MENLITTANAILDPAITVLIVLVTIALGVTAYRLLTGPSYADRFIAIDMMTALAVAACARTALATGRGEFLDVAFGLALIAFVAAAAFAGFLERKAARVRSNGSGQTEGASS